MARKRAIAFVLPDPPPDPRPHGSLVFADPSTTEMTRSVHVYNEPKTSAYEGAGRHGVRSLDPRTYRWQGGSVEHDIMRRKRGYSDEEEAEE